MKLIALAVVTAGVALTGLVGCTSEDPGGGAGDVRVQAPESVPAGETFALTAPDGWLLRMSHTVARQEDGSQVWVLVGASEGETPSAREGETVEDVLDVSARSLDYAFPEGAMTGSYRLCVTLSPADEDTRTEEACVDIAVT